MAELFLHHYTNQTGLAGIITSKSLWAGKISHLNDTTELQHGITLAKRLLTTLSMDRRVKWLEDFCSSAQGALDRIANINVFVVSFSERFDLLSQWRAYSQGEIGYSVGFAQTRLEQLASKQGFTLRKCIYDPQRQQQEVQGFVKRFIDSFQWNQTPAAMTPEMLANKANEFAFQFASFSPLLKHHAFSEEAEWRLSSEPKSDGDSNYCVRSTNLFLAPYYVFSLKDDAEECKIDKIVIGPCPEKRLTSNGVTGLLRKNNIKGYSVSYSEIPFRRP